MIRSIWVVLVFCLVLGSGAAWADPAPFDLAGPKIQVNVTRGGKTLPISAVPNLQTGDQIQVRAEFGKTQSARYLMVVAFLRGATNPPPEDWFYASETWKPDQSSGLRVTAPAGAQQMLIFLAPSTGGALHTLIGAVRGRPGSFVRASQDLNQATLDRARLKVYLTAVRKLNLLGGDQLKKSSPLLARSLSIKLNADCLEKSPELQASCLMQGQEALILNDGHSESVAATLTSGAPLDLIGALSVTPTAKSGYYSPYVASLVDIVRIFDSFHTAQYQYIPALSAEQGDELSLELNTPPSFHNPKSVIVVALPAIQGPQPPPLRPVDPKSVYCAEKNDLVLPVEGAPLVFATGYARGMALRLKQKSGKEIDLPLTVDAGKGGLVAVTSGVNSADYGNTLEGSVHGFWGFEPYDGPGFHLESAHPQQWRPLDNEANQIEAGHDATLHLETENAACVDSVTLESAAGQSLKAEWKSEAPNRIEVAAPIKKLKPGPFKLLIRQYGSKTSDPVPLYAFAPAGRLDSFVYHVGDATATLKGARLKDVKSVTVKNAVFTPAEKEADGGEKSFTLLDPKTAAELKAGDSLTAKVLLLDGRTMPLETTVAAPRPVADLLAKSVQAAPESEAIRFKLGDENELPSGATLIFSVRARIPAAFAGSETIELKTEQGGAQATLTSSNGLTLADAHTLVATVNTAKLFPSSAAGALSFRLVSEGIAGQWLPLATLVRLPALHQLACNAQNQCTLSGNRLYLLDSISADAQFANPVQVPNGFPGFTLATPEPAGGRLFVKLHDSPSVVNVIELPASGPAIAPSAVTPPAKDSAASTKEEIKPVIAPAPQR